jgi:hypothetical protein
LVSDFGPLLQNLQNDLAQLLPLIAAFNDNFDFHRVGLPSSPGSVTPGTGVNASSSVAANVSTHTGVNAGVNASVSPFGTAPARAVSETGVNGTGTVSGANTTTAPGIGGTGTLAGNATVGGLGDTNAVGGFSGARDTLRALVILQSDMQRMLPLITALNGGTLGNLPIGLTGLPGAFTNSFASGTNIFVPAAPARIATPPANPPRALTPTGR